MRTRGLLRFVPIGVLMAVAIGASICGCGSGASTLPSGATLTITSLSPTSTTAGGPGFTLTVLGSNFVSSSVVRWNGTAKPTNFVSSAQLTAQISTSDIAATGTVAITVFDTAPGGGTSNGVNFNIEVIPAPAITNLSPTSTTAGGPGFTLTVLGSNFVSSSVVRWNGTAKPTNFASSAQLTAQISTSDIAATGTVAVTVFNPAPGGGSSNGMNFTIQTNPIPTINGFDTRCAPVGAQAFTLGVFGLNFVASSVVRWNGSDRPTAFVNSFGPPYLTAQIPASDIAAAGTAAVTVFNPAPGGGDSNSLTFTIATGGVFPRSIAVDPTGKFAYVANEGCLEAFVGDVSMYTIDPTTGALTPKGPPVAAGLDPHSVAVDPSGKFAYVANAGVDVLPGSVSMYTINATTGALASIGTINADQNAPFSVAVHPSGKFVYVANEGGYAPTSVSMYTINATTGVLTLVGVVAAGGRAISVAVDPMGKFAYVANASNGFPGEADDVSMYTINTTSGTLTSIGTIAAGAFPSAIAVDPSGKFAYVTNSNSNDVSMYTINAATAALTSLGLIAAGTNPASMAVDPSGKFAYVTNSGSNDVSMYTINAATGALTSIGTIAAELFPTSIAITPSGKFAYVTNQNSHNVSIYSIDSATGALTLIGTIGT
jgi:YVTN family beta-propeller protein